MKKLKKLIEDKHFIISFILSYIIFFIYSYIFFNMIIVSLIISFFISIKFYKIIKDILDKKDLKFNRIMFREFLDIFNTNIITGQNFYMSLKLTSKEIQQIFQEKTYIVKFLEELVIDIDNGVSYESGLKDFKKKCNLEEVDIFIDSIIIALKSGIDISKISMNSKNMLTENISLELELQTIVDRSKKDFLIMSILPLVVLLLLSITSNTALTYIDYIIRIPIFILFIFSFNIGNKIVNLEL